MKRTLFFAMILACGVISAATRQCRLTADSFNGTLMDGPSIVLRKNMAMQQGKEPVVLEAENADSIFFQADVFARKSGAQGIDLVQIKRPASEYTPQDDIADASGKYIDFCQQAEWQFSLKTYNSYRIWLRVQVPFTANWGHEMKIDNIRNGVDVGATCKQAKKWYWVCAIECGLKPGVHKFSIANFMNGKRLDQIAIMPHTWRPENGDALPTTPLVKFTDGSVEFGKAAPYGLKKWKRLIADDVPGVEWQLSNDGGETFKSLKPGDDLSGYSANEISIKATMKTVNGESPRIKEPMLEYEHDENAFSVLRSDTAEWYFTKENGCLSGIVSRISGRELQPVGQRLPMFTLVFKVPNGKERKALTEKEAKLLSQKLSKNEKRLQMTWAFNDTPATLELELNANGQLVSWDVTAKNNDEKFDIIEIQLPRLNSIRINESPKDDLLAWPFTSGEFIKGPATRGTQKVVYPDHAGIGFTDVCGKDEGLFLGILDEFVVASTFLCEATPAMNAIDLSITKMHRIKSKSSRTYHFTTAVHAGDWHSGAKIYRDWFYSKHPVNTYRPWLRNADAWHFGGSLGHTGLVSKYADYTAFRRDIIAAARLGLDYIQSWGAVFNGACPAYYLPRKEKGGEEMFAAMMKEWRDLGGKVGHYYYANGLAVYYLLSDKYFCTPWSEYPEDVRPPSYEWFLKNKTYREDAPPQPPMEELMATINQLNKEIAADTITTGMAEEGRKPLGGHLSMNWSNGEYAAFLYKWIDRYVSKYNCNTAYLDTFAFSNAQPEFNPYLGMNGEGDKPMHKVAFLKKMIADMRKKEPEFCVLTEGVGDVFGAEGLYFLLSGFARQPAMYRYTLPDHIFFQGGCNGLWGQPKMEESTRQAFLHGNRFDLTTMFPKVYLTLKLKQTIAPFMNQSVFEDTIGVTTDTELVECYAHVCGDDGGKIIANSGTRSVTLAISNPSNVDGRITYKLPKGFKLNSAVLCELGEKPKKVSLEVKDGAVSFDAPKAFLAALVLIDRVRGDHEWTAYAEQMDKNAAVVNVFNFTPAKRKFTINLFGQQKQVEIEGLNGDTVDFTYNGDVEKPSAQKVVVSDGRVTRNSLISIGGDFSAIKYRIGKPKVTFDKPLFIDFETPNYPAENPKDGRRAMKLVGTGKYCYSNIHIGLEPEKTYELEFDICKTEKCNPSDAKCFAMMCNYPSSGNLERYVICAGQKAVPNDGQYHHVKTTFKTGKDVASPALYIYNIDSDEGIVYLDNLSIKVKLP